MQTRTLGRTGLRVGEISLGAEHVGPGDARLQREILETAVDGGINLVDTIFTSVDARDEFGRVLSKMRSRLLLTGHLGQTFPSGKYRRTRDPAECERAFLELLRVLSTDYIDLLMLHWVDEPEDVDRVLDPEGYYGLARRLREQGKARYFGISTHTVSVARRAVEGGYVDAVMFPVNAAHDVLPGDGGLRAMWEAGSWRSGEESGEVPAVGPAPDRTGLFELCERRGVGILAMKPYAGGLLLTEPVLSDWLARKNVLHPADITLTPVQALSYVLSRPGVTTAVVGCRSPEEVSTALGYCGAPDAERDFSVLEGSSLWRLQGRCTYCNHCLPCPAGIRIGDVMRSYDVSGSGGGAGPADLPAGSAPPSACTKCGVCESRCPFGVSVIEAMTAAVAVFR